MSNLRKSGVSVDYTDSPVSTSDVGCERRITRTRSRSLPDIRAGKESRAESSGSAEATHKPVGRSTKRSSSMRSRTKDTVSPRNITGVPTVGDGVKPGPSGVQRGSSVARKSVPEAALQYPDEMPEHRVQQSSRQQQQDDGIIMMLTNEDAEGTLVVRPQNKQTISSLPSPGGCSLTLTCLQTGLGNYEKIQADGEEAEYVEAFCCKIPKLRRYQPYKKVILVDPMSENNQYRGSQGLFELIRLYVRCFATLSNFDFDYNITTPYSGEGLPNVLVVDKVWRYDSESATLKPNYFILKGDFYTHHVMQRLKDFYRCRTIRFISTAHTSFFANHSALTNRNPNEPKHFSDTVATASTSGTAVDSTATARRPLKKRKEVLLSNVEQHEDKLQPVNKKKRVTFADRQTPIGLSNPTLIIFRPNIVNSEPELLCVISVEVHLSDRFKCN